MKSLDTNIFLRYLVIEDEELHGKSARIFKDIEEGKYNASVSILVLNEILWVLKRYYGVKPKDSTSELRKLLALKGIKILETKKRVIMQVLDILEEVNIDFTDIYLSRVVEKKDLISFDKDFEELYEID